ncbi:MAG: hypothetical protein NVS9B7_09910 [Flavisolibacter sp.]
MHFAGGIQNGEWITMVPGPINRLAMSHPLNLLIRFPRITKNYNFILLGGTKKREAYTIRFAIINSTLNTDSNQSV